MDDRLKAGHATDPDKEMHLLCCAIVPCIAAIASRRAGKNLDAGPLDSACDVVIVKDSLHINLLDCRSARDRTLY